MHLNLHIKTLLWISVRRVPPQFTIRPESEYRVMRGSDLEVTCVAVGSPMPHVKWRKGSEDVSTNSDLRAKIGKNVLRLGNIQESANYTCVAGSKLGIIEAATAIFVQGMRDLISFDLRES